MPPSPNQSRHCHEENVLTPHDRWLQTGGSASYRRHWRNDPKRESSQLLGVLGFCHFDSRVEFACSTQPPFWGGAIATSLNLQCKLPHAYRGFRYPQEGELSGTTATSSIRPSSGGKYCLAQKQQLERQVTSCSLSLSFLCACQMSIATSRSLGDFDFKADPSREPEEQMISPVPEFYTRRRQVAVSACTVDSIHRVTG